MEAEKSYYLSSASWTPKKAGDIIRRAESWRADGVDSFQSRSESRRTRNAKEKEDWEMCASQRWNRSAGEGLFPVGGIRCCFKGGLACHRVNVRFLHCDSIEVHSNSTCKNYYMEVVT